MLFCALGEELAIRILFYVLGGRALKSEVRRYVNQAISASISANLVVS